MPDSLDSVRALYEEPRPDGMMPTPESLSDAARGEVAALAPVKAALDARPSAAPDAATVAAVLEAARAAAALHAGSVQHAGAVPRHAADRAPAQASRRSRFRVAMPALALLACVAVGIALVAQQNGPLSGADSPRAAAPDAEAIADAPVAEAAPQAESVARNTVPLTEDEAAPSLAAPTAAQASEARRPAPPQAAQDERAGPVAAATASADAQVADRAASPAAAQEAGTNRPTQSPPAIVSAQPGLRLTSTAPATAVTSWENPSDEELRLLSLRLQMLRESNQGLAWDEPPVALSAAPSETLRMRDLTPDTMRRESRVGFNAVQPQRIGWIRVEEGGQ